MTDNAIFKIDRFAVPEAVRDEFLGRVRSIRDFLETQPGCLQNLILEQAGDAGTPTIMTIVQWEDSEAFANARAAAFARYAESGFSPAEFIARLGVRAEMGNFGALA